MYCYSVTNNFPPPPSFLPHFRDWVKNGRDVSSKEVSLADAKAIKGLRAVFGEVRPAHVDPYVCLQLPAVHAVDAIC